jgi:hypothetical protein
MQGTQFTCFAGTKVQILTPLHFLFLARIELRGQMHATASVEPLLRAAGFTRQLLALLVQKYKY